MGHQTHTGCSLKCIAAALNNLAAKIQDIHDLTDVSVEIYLEALQAMKEASEQNCHKDRETTRAISANYWKNKLERRKSDCAPFLKKMNDLAIHLNCLAVCPKTTTLKDETGFSQALHITSDEFDDDHFLSSMILYNIGLLQKEKGSLQYSIQFFSLALNTIAGRDELGCLESLLCVLIQHNMGLIHRKQGCAEEANNAFSEARKFGQLSLGHSNARVPSNCSTMGNISKRARYALRTLSLNRL